MVATLDGRLTKLRLRRIGNSLGVGSPKEVLDALSAEGLEGETLTIARLPDGAGKELRHVDARFEPKLALLRDTMKRFKNTLRELAR